ncbi:MAG: hypothetical protein WDM90_19815 [Ferruginibacter sp.]
MYSQHTPLVKDAGGGEASKRRYRRRRSANADEPNINGGINMQIGDFRI